MRLGLFANSAASMLLGLSLVACGTRPGDADIRDQALRMNLPESGGRITGQLLYPESELPQDLQICAADLATGQENCQFIRVDDSYLMDLPPGTYVVWAFTEDMPGVLAYYTKAVNCGLGPECTDHSPMAVTIADGTVIEGVNLGDWFGM